MQNLGSKICHSETKSIYKLLSYQLRRMNLFQFISHSILNVYYPLFYLTMDHFLPQILQIMQITALIP